MRIKTPWTYLIAAAALCGAGSSLEAQEYSSPGRVYGEISLSRIAFGHDFGRPVDLTNPLNPDSTFVRPGFGVDLAIVIPAQSPLMLAAGLTYTSHPTAYPGPNSGNLAALQFYLEPRIMLRKTGKLIPYVAARIGYARTAQAITLIGDDGVEQTSNAVQTGTAYGAGAGLIWYLRPHVRAYAAGGWQKVSLGDIDFAYSHVQSSSASPSWIYMRAGVSLEFSPTASAGLKSFSR